MEPSPVAPSPSPTPAPNQHFIMWLCAVAIGAGMIGYGTGTLVATTTITNHDEQRLNSSKYRYINPLLDKIEYESAPLLTREVDILKEKIDDITATAISDELILSGSVYYRDLNNGPWFTSGEVESIYKPASLFKIPVMIAYFKQAELDASILDKKISYEIPYTNTAIHSVDSSDKTITLGKSYTVRELIEYMIIYSDNLAAYLLLENVDSALITQVFTDLSITLPNADAASERINPRTYASFFRILYNATYLNPTYSELALEILSQSAFNHGIREALKANTRASLKFGIARDGANEVQLHECGIIYWHTDRPHLLCIMSIGTEYEVMAQYLKNVTSAVQDAVTP